MSRRSRDRYPEDADFEGIAEARAEARAPSQWSQEDQYERWLDAIGENQ